MQYFQCNSSSKEYINNQAPSNLPTQYSKKEEMASSKIGGHKKKKKNVEIIGVISFLEETMKTLKDLWRTIENKTANVVIIF